MKFKLTMTITGAAIVLSACNNVKPNVSTEFKVWGNCSMCKKTIENSLDVSGIAEANWDMETKRMEVSYDSTLISIEQIQKIL
ncbi:MAG: cation transporter [Flavobacteriales bacterium]|nr:cation transporter [Flavobacteriales bacterium]